MNADSIAGVLRQAFPVPDERFARALWMGEAAEACAALSRLYTREEAALTGAIRSEGAVSEVFELREVRRPYATVNIGLLREKEPEVYEAAVHVRQAFAESVLGRRRLYELVAEVLGEQVSEHEVVNVTDVRRMLPSGEAALYVCEGEEFVKYQVVAR